MDNISLSEKEYNEFLSSFTTLKISVVKQILHVQLNREKSLNALNEVLFEELNKLFSNLNYITDIKDIRVIILSGKGKAFTSGLDLRSKIAENIIGIKTSDKQPLDVGRKSFFLYNAIKKIQSYLNSIENCHLPVIGAIHGYCLGGGVSLLTCLDVKIAEKNSIFSIKEVDIGLTADLGALQRLVKQTGREGLVKKYSFTGETFSAEEALKLGIIDEINDDALKRAFELAEKMCEKSPLVLWGIKRMVNFARDNTTASSLDMVATLNSALIQSDDITKTLEGVLLKKKAFYPKL